MAFLRSSFFVAIMSLLVLSGYASDVLEGCCHESGQEQTQVEKGDQDHHGDADGDGCQCFCHQGFTANAVETVRVAPEPLRTVELFGVAVEFPADREPVGIEHPPQLA